MRQRVDKEAKTLLSDHKGLAYDLTLKFNAIKEKRGGSRFRHKINPGENILNPVVLTGVVQNAYITEEKLEELTTIRDKLKKCKELYDRNAFQNEKIHSKVELLNQQASRVQIQKQFINYQLISDIEDDIIRIKRDEDPKDSRVLSQSMKQDLQQVIAKKNARINLSLRLQDLVTTIRDINLKFLMSNPKFTSQEHTDWFHKAMLDKDLNDILIEQIIVQETEAEAVAKRRDDDITNIVNSFNKITQQFKQLQLLVIEQGTLIDRIDYNLETAEKNVGKGRDQLRKMQGYEKMNTDSCARRVIIIEAILIFIFSILLYIKFRSRIVYEASDSPIVVADQIQE